MYFLKLKRNKKYLDAGKLFAYYTIILVPFYILYNKNAYFY